MKKLKPLICVCLLSSMLMAAQALSPGISRLITFYGVPESAVSLSITLPYLISIPFTLLAGRLTERFPLKGLLMTGAAIICVTGLLPCIITNFTAILIVRACMGIGLGLLFTLTPSMAPEYYPEGQLRRPDYRNAVRLGRFRRFCIQYSERIPGTGENAEYIFVYFCACCLQSWYGSCCRQSLLLDAKKKRRSAPASLPAACSPHSLLSCF